ncbi:MAG: tripartite tricarboxylate transporter substrate binding protein BugD [Xanthobacteraceae bacterium]|nr:tripartite tricarboxylate transporter substrate binding protein BugD [Xanthobacteraceae bacterium]
MKKLLGAILLATLAGISVASAQSYPSRPVTLIVPFAAGGATDVLARFLADRMRAGLGQPVVIENVTGAGGTIGVGRAMRAPADGYTMQIGTSTTNVMTGALYQLQFDLLTDLDPIIQIASEPMMIVVKKDFPAGSLKEMIAWLKANPDKASAGIPALGGTGHLTGLAFQKETGTKFTFVPYRGNGPALQDLVAGQIDLQMEPASNFYAQVKAGAIRPFAMTSKARIGAAPDIPTAEEAGLPGFVASLWYGVWVPKGTPKEIAARLNTVMMETLADPTVTRKFQELGLEKPAREQQTPEALRAFQKAEVDKWWPVIKAHNIRGQ